MVHFLPFRAIRPKKEYAAGISSLPYDVISEDEARQTLKKNELSFVKVIRSEVDLPEGTDPYSSQVYDRARDNLDAYIRDGFMLRDKSDCYYIYREIYNGKAQTGIAGVIPVDDYEDMYVRRHELTLPEKETDRLDHFMACGAHTEPVFLMVKPDMALNWMIGRITGETPAEYDFTDEYGVTQQLWIVSDAEDIANLKILLSGHELFYIADGHHRTASAVRVAKALSTEKDTGEEEYYFFMACVFPADELTILDYNRLVKDFGELSDDEFLSSLEESFEVTRLGEMKRPPEKHMFTMYLGGYWYRLIARSDAFDVEDPIASLDVSILQDNVFSKILDIKDPTTSDRLKFVGGIKGYDCLRDAVDSGEYKAAFMLYPVDYEQIMTVADQKLIMPPKSTWFEPKLRSGLFIHRFN